MDFSVLGINGSDYSAVVNQTQNKDLENKLNNIASTGEANEMMEACKEFETYMIEQIYKNMEKTIMKAEEEENEYETYFGDMRIQEYAKAVMEQGGFGLANQMYEAMCRNTAVKPIVEATTE